MDLRKLGYGMRTLHECLIVFVSKKRGHVEGNIGSNGSYDSS